MVVIVLYGGYDVIMVILDYLTDVLAFSVRVV